MTGVVGVAANQVLGHPPVPERVAQSPPLYEDEDHRDNHDGSDDRSCGSEILSITYKVVLLK